MPPEEYQGPIPGAASEITKAVYGLEEALADFDEHFGKVAENLSDESGSLELERLMTEPAAFQSKLTGFTMCEDIDDGTLLGPSEAPGRTLAAMGKLLLFKISSPQLGSETQFIGRLLVKTEFVDFRSNILRSFLTVCCPALVLGAALLYILRV